MSRARMDRRLFALGAAAALMSSLPADRTAAAAIQRGPNQSGPNPDPWPGAKKVLFIADVQSGYHHDAINHTMAVVERLGREAGAFVTFFRTDSQLITKRPLPPQGRYVGGNINAKTMDYFDAIFLLPSGYGTMSEEQKQALLSYVRDDGKGLVVGHAAGAAFTSREGTTWPEWGPLIGGVMDRRPGHSGEFRADCRVIVEDPAFPGASAWGTNSFMFDEQHPLVAPPYSRDKVRVILRLDPATVPERYREHHPDGDYPVAWAHRYGKGRVFNMGWGEFESTWDDPGFQQLMLGAIKWALGTESADVTPRPLVKPGTTAAR